MSALLKALQKAALKNAQQLSLEQEPIHLNYKADNKTADPSIASENNIKKDTEATENSNIASNIISLSRKKFFEKTTWIHLILVIGLSFLTFILSQNLLNKNFLPIAETPPITGTTPKSLPTSTKTASTNTKAFAAIDQFNFSAVDAVDTSFQTEIKEKNIFDQPTVDISDVFSDLNFTLHSYPKSYSNVPKQEFISPSRPTKVIIEAIPKTKTAETIKSLEKSRSPTKNSELNPQSLALTTSEVAMDSNSKTNSNQQIFEKNKDLIANGYHQLAFNSLSQHLLAFPKDQAAMDLLFLLIGKVDPARMTTTLTQLIQLQPNSSQLLFALGNVMAAQAQWQTASQYFIEALTINPKNPDIMFNAAVSSEHLNQQAQALRFYQQALMLSKLNPASFPAEVVQIRLNDLKARLSE